MKTHFVTFVIETKVEVSDRENAYDVLASVLSRPHRTTPVGFDYPRGFQYKISRGDLVEELERRGLLRRREEV
jgi:hypothetical protein